MHLRCIVALLDNKCYVTDPSLIIVMNKLYSQAQRVKIVVGDS